MSDQYDSRRPHDDHSGCSNGFIYTMGNKIQCLFTGNSNSPQFQDAGLVDGSSVNVTLPTHFDNGDPVYIAAYDRLYLAEESIAVVEWHLQTYHLSGTDKLNRPVLKVQDLVDSRGIYYQDGVDFEVRSGQIVWLTENRPGIDQETGKGRVYAVRYLYRPYFYIKRIEHEVRVSQSDNPVTGERTTIRMPQSVTLQREFIFENEMKDPDAVHPESLRQGKGPSNGSFGPR
jgi:hypothetical protein